MWEDPANESGGEWQCRQSFDLRELNVHWENMVNYHHSHCTRIFDLLINASGV
jgi:hypothetical protein